MLRRNLLRFVFPVAVGAVFEQLEPLYGNEIVPWGTPVNSLKIGLRLEQREGSRELAVLLRNEGSAPRDLYLWDGEIPRIDFMGRDKAGREYSIKSRLLYRPCAGLCSWPPIIKRLESGSTEKVPFPLDELLYVPTKGPYATLTSLLRRGYSVQAAFEITGRELKESKLSPESPWLGRVLSAELREDQA